MNETKSIDQCELDEILYKHSLWLGGKIGGKKADLRYLDLSDLNFYNRSLQYADLSYTDLQYADLQYVNLCETNLWSAILYNADLRGADINKDNPSVFYKSENITILDTGFDCFYTFNDTNVGVLRKEKDLDYFKEAITVISLNTHKFIL